MNLDILTLNPIIYFLFLVPVFGLFAYATYGKNKPLTESCQAVIDALPAYMLLLYNGSNLFFILFIIGILIAVPLLRANIVAGAILYAIIYSTAGIIGMVNNMLWTAFITSCGIVLAMIMLAISIRIDSLKTWVKAGGICYGIVAFIPLIYGFLTTLNPGFLCVVIADTLLAIFYLNKNKHVWYISNLFFYTGVWLIPLSLF